MSFEQLWRELAPVGRSADGGYVRQPFTSAEREAVAWFRDRCTERGLAVAQDGFGNLVAWWHPEPGQPRRGAVLTGSHLDSVPAGGAYDGPLGVVSALAAVDLLRSRGHRPAAPLGIAVFMEEEGSRFGVACLGSRLATGAWSWERARRLRDRSGTSLADLVAGEPAGRDPTGPGRPSGLLAGVRCFVELHVEQGRDLVHRGEAVGVASAIWPHGRYRFDFSGEANHAGTTRMQDRRDPMLTFAATALAARQAAGHAGRRATFGRLEVSPNGTNSVPSGVTAWLDARASSGDDLARLLEEITGSGQRAARDDGTRLTTTTESVSGPVAFDDALARLLAGRPGRARPAIPTGAGHDAGVLAAAGIPSGMLFVRNPTGVSHSPAEHADTADCLAGVEALADCLGRLTS